MAVLGRERFDFLKRFVCAFWLCIAAQTFPAAFAPKAAFAYAAETGGRVHHVRAVDPDDARDQFRRDIQSQIDVFRPD